MDRQRPLLRFLQIRLRSMSFGLNESEEFMKSILIGIVAGVLIASTVGAFQADEHKSVSPIGGMM